MQYTYFYNLTSPFSNFHPAKFIYKNVQFISNEQFMMYCKAKLFKDEETATKILDVNNWELPRKFLSGQITREQIINDQELCETWKRIMMSVKRYGREVKNYDDPMWSDKRYNIVKRGGKEKFEQNEDLKSIILNTGNTLMCEAASHDSIWGCGLNEYNAKKTNPKDWPGLNLLGHALDEVKSYLFEMESRKTKVEDKTKESNIEVHNFYKLGKVIPEDGVYIGRYSKQHNLNQSIFANPYRVETSEERGKTIEKYRVWLLEQIASGTITKEDLMTLNNKKLVCYCKPLSCHGDVLKETVELLINNEKEFDVLISKHQKIKKPGLI